LTFVSIPNSKFRISHSTVVTAKANAKKIMVMLHVIGHAKENQRTFRI